MQEVNSSNNLSYTPQSYTVQDFPPSRPNWVPLLNHPQASVAPSPFGSMGGVTLACGGGCWGSNSDEGTDTLLLYVNYNTSLRYTL
jgi:hypothetical protein